MANQPLPAEDLAHILAHAGEAFATLTNANLFITGGTGFFGHSLLESLLHANQALKLNVRATVLTRNARRFQDNSPHITTDPAITLLEGDIRTFQFPTENHTHILHAATDSSGQQAHRTQNDLHDDILTGTRHVLDFAQHTGATRLLYTSTGAVYGRSTPLLHTPETYLDTAHPHLPPNSYESAKRAAELLCLSPPNLQAVPAPPQKGVPHVPLLGHGREPSLPEPVLPRAPLQVVIARCFAFVGPHLPLDQHFAIGNFIAAALANRPIHITGDGTPRRSWLYTADLAIWLWTLLTHGQSNRAYNVGSDQSYSIAQAAHLTATTLSSRPEPATNLSSRPDPEHSEGEVERSAGRRGDDHHPVPIQIDATPNPSAPLNSYVPDITRAHTELGLTVRIPLDEALRRTAAWHNLQ